MTGTSNRAKYVALTGCVLSVIFFIVTFVLGFSTRVYPVWALSWQILGTAMVWFVVLLHFHQRSLAEREKLDLDKLAKTGDSETIFQSSESQKELFAVAQRRLRVFEKWFLPSLSLLIALYHIAISLYLLLRAQRVVGEGFQNLLPGGVLLIVVAFVSFLISRYATGMSGVTVWKPLRAGGSFLLATALLSFACGLGLGLASYNWDGLIRVLWWLIPGLLAVIGLEVILNVILDIYRPRLAGQYHRAGLDSRLLGLINEPGGFFRTFASAMDYQFGFKVSQTWFYKLLEQAIVPLILFGAVILYAMSSVVIIGPGEEAIVEHLGRPRNEGTPYGPGLHWKWPFPFDRAYKYPTKMVQNVNVGFVEGEEGKRPESLLWGEQHFKEEYDLLVATRAESVQEVEGGMPVSMVRANVPVHYRIRDLYSYVYNYQDARKALEAICYRELVRFAVSAKIEADEGGIGEEPLSLLGAGRGPASRELKQNIQKAADQMGLGVEITLLGLQGIHPPPEVAPSYQDVVGSLQKRQASILQAMADRASTLTNLSGSVTNAQALYDLARQYQQAKESQDEQKAQQLAMQMRASFGDAKGEVFALLAQAKAYAYERAALSEATSRRFQGQLQAYEAFPKYYLRDRRLAMLEEALQNIRKYVVVPGDEDQEVFIVDLQEKLSPSIYDMEVDEFTQQ